MKLKEVITKVNFNAYSEISVIKLSHEPFLEQIAIFSIFVFFLFLHNQLKCDFAI